MRIGVDLGGTKIEACLLDEAGAFAVRERVDTPRGDYDATVAAIAGLVRSIEARHGTCSVGIGMPGTISPATGRVKNANSTCLNDRPLKQDLERTLARPLRLANDANCFALSEARGGAADGAAIVFGVILGTGVGGGVVVNGQVLTGPNAIAGEWGHNPMPAPRRDEMPGPQCYCGRWGCIETFLCGTAFTRDLVQRGGPTLSGAAIVAAAAGGDRFAEATVARYEERLARALGSIINVLDPDVIVLGGGLSNVPSLYENVPHLWGEFVFSDRVDTKLVPPAFGDSSGVRGAAWLWD